MTEKVLSKDFLLTQLSLYAGVDVSKVRNIEREQAKLLLSCGDRVPMYINRSLAVLFEYSKAVYAGYVVRSVNGDRSMAEIPLTLQGNYHSYGLVCDMWEHRSEFVEMCQATNDQIESATRQSELSLSARTTIRGILPELRSTGPVFPTKNAREMFITCQSLAICLEQARDKMLEQRNNILSGVRVSDRLQFIEKWCSYFDTLDKRAKFKRGHGENKLWMVSWGSLIGVCSNVGSMKNIRWLTDDYLRRSIELLKTCSHIALSASSVSYRGSVESVIDNILAFISDVSDEDPNAVGEAWKGARGVLVFEGEPDPIMSNDPVKAFYGTMSKEKARRVRRAVRLIKRVSGDANSMINLGNLYKSSLHPDADMHAIFEGIKGFREANSVTPSKMPRFRGTLRRALFGSMSRLHDPRLQSTGEAGQKLAQQSDSAFVPLAAMKSTTWRAWDDVRFKRVSTITRPSDIEIKPADKASQLPDPGDDELLSQMRKWSQSLRGGKCEDGKLFGTVNDLTSVLEGTSNLNPAKAIRKFKRIIRWHEAFENKHPALNIQDIPSGDLEAFLMANHAARFMVGTEPKLGELHKVNTRMFYLGEQVIKAITQRVERVARQVSGNQSGVSIVKSYTAKRRDCERFARAMGGKGGNSSAVFVSFDLAEFSKKFPQELIRAYGSELADITGEDWLKRIDVIFRAAVVLNNTRGYFDYVAGVLGAFEGFFNFVWSSTHAVVMEIALDSIGLAGELQTYSDDGILYFLAGSDVTNAELKELVDRIIKVYDDHGLTFHVFKSFVSKHIWEYLGDICKDGHIIPMFLKEVGSFGKHMRGGGVLTVSDTIDQLIGQGRALCKAGYSPNVAYFLVRFYSQLKISRICSSNDKALIEALLITPRSCNGFRIPSPMEMCAASNISNDAEFVADLNIYEMLDKRVSSLVCSYMISRIPKPSRAITSIINGTRFRVQGASTSGLGIMNRMIDEIIETTGTRVARNPITAAIEKKILDLCKNITNLEPEIIMFFIQSLVVWDEYNKSLAMVKGSSATKLLDRGRVKYYQSQDSKAVSAALVSWMDHESRNTKVSTMIRAFSEKFTCSIDLRPLKPAFRDAVIRVERSGDIAVRLSLDVNKLLTNQSYLEPISRFSRQATSLGWLAESGATGGVKSVRKLMDAVSSLITYNPDLLHPMIDLAGIFDIHIPSIPLGVLGNAARLGVSEQKKSDVTLWIPSMFMALSSVEYSTVMSQKIYNTPSIDRVTYLEMARAYSAINFDACINKGLEAIREVTLYHYHIREDYMGLMHDPFPMGVKDGYRPMDHSRLAPITRTIGKEFERGFMEHVSGRKLAEDVENMTRRVEGASEDTKIILKSITREKMRRWMSSMLRSRSHMLSAAPEIPYSYLERSEDLSYAIQVAAYLNVVPNFRQALRNSIYRARGIAVLEPDDDLVSQGITDYKEGMFRLIETITTLFPDVLDTPGIYQMAGAPVGSHTHLREFLDVQSMYGDAPIHIIRPWSAVPGTANEKYREVTNTVYTNSISYLYNLARGLGWNRDSLREILPTQMSIDLTIDQLYIQRSMLRTSSHRSRDKPSNVISVVITGCKFYRSVYRTWAVVSRAIRLGAESDDTSLRALIRSSLVLAPCDSVKRMIYGKYRTLGGDHERILNDDLDDTIGTRILSVVRYLIRNNKTPDPFRSCSDLVQDATAFYEGVIKPYTSRVVELPSATEEILSGLGCVWELNEIATSSSYITSDSKIHGELMTASEVMSTPSAKDILSKAMRSYTRETCLQGLSMSRSPELGNIDFQFSSSGETFVHFTRSIEHRDIEAACHPRSAYVEAGHTVSMVVRTKSIRKAMQNLSRIATTIYGEVVPYKEGAYYYTVAIGLATRDIRGVNRFCDIDQSLTSSESLAVTVFAKKTARRVGVLMGRVGRGSKVGAAGVERFTVFRLAGHSRATSVSDPRMIAAHTLFQTRDSPNSRVAMLLLLRSAVYDTKVGVQVAWFVQKMRSGGGSSATIEREVEVATSWFCGAEFAESADHDYSLVNDYIKSVNHITSSPDTICQPLSTVVTNVPRGAAEVLSGVHSQETPLVDILYRRSNLIADAPSKMMDFNAFMNMELDM